MDFVFVYFWLHGNNCLRHSVHCQFMLWNIKRPSIFTFMAPLLLANILSLTAVIRKRRKTTYSCKTIYFRAFSVSIVLDGTNTSVVRPCVTITPVNPLLYCLVSQRISNCSQKNSQVSHNYDLLHSDVYGSTLTTIYNLLKMKDMASWV